LHPLEEIVYIQKNINTCVFLFNKQQKTSSWVLVRIPTANMALSLGRFVERLVKDF
jgi:hypothetical protein